jgi:hypothetical protein
MNRILFLDFDGPLFPTRVIKYGQGPGVAEWVDRNFDSGHNAITYCYMDNVAVGALNALHKVRPFDIVVTSTWAEFCTKNQIESLFVLNGLQPPLHTNWKARRMVREEGITDWLKRNPGKDYIVLDDPWSFPAIIDDVKMLECGFDLGVLIVVDPNIGLLMEDIERMYEIWG